MAMPAMSLRTRIVLLVLLVGVLPMALLGVWLNRSAARSGRALLMQRLEDAVETSANTLGRRWILLRSELLDLADGELARRALMERSSEAAPVSGNVDLGPAVWSALIRDPDGVIRWQYRDARPGFDSWAAGDPLLLSVAFDAGKRPSTATGRLEAEVSLHGLLGSSVSAGSAPGMIIGAFARTDRAPLLAVPFDPVLLLEERFQWGGEEWMTARRELREPAVEVVAATPVGPFSQPFESAASRGLWLVLAVTLLGLGVGSLVTGRITRSLEQLAGAVDAVAEGDLERRVAIERNDEVGRVARAFNTMTEGLQRTLRRLAERESLAAVGEFAASMAHEIRNPLSAVLVDLERVEEGLPENSELRRPQRRALGQIERLNRAVTGSLQLARSGRLDLEQVDFLEVLRAAAHASTPALAAHNAVLELPAAETGPVVIRGDPAKLEQLFLNLLLNAAQALDDGGTIRVDAVVSDGTLLVSVRDTGSGIPDADLERVFEPFYSTRRQGTGLGLATARRIARAHGGELDIEALEGGGTLARVRLPARGAGVATDSGGSSAGRERDGS